MIFLDTCLLIDYSKEKIDIDLRGDYCINSVVSYVLYYIYNLDIIGL